MKFLNDDRLDSIKSMLATVGLICTVFVGSVLVVGVAQESQRRAPSAANLESRMPNPQAVPLTHEEGLEIELNLEKMTNVNLQAERVERQIAEARKTLIDENEELTAKLAKAHGLDPAKYRLDPQAKAFVPLAPPAPAPPTGKR